MASLQSHCRRQDALFGADSLLIILYDNARVFGVFTASCIDRMVRPLLFLTFTGPCVVVYSYNKTNEMHRFLKFIFGIELYMFRTVSLSIIRSLAPYTQQYIQVMLSAC
jgi:hypothetical protein